MILKEEKRGSNVIISELVPDILLTLQVLNATRQEPSFNSSLFPQNNDTETSLNSSSSFFNYLHQAVSSLE